MDTLALFAVLQLLQGTQLVPLNTPCLDIIRYERGTDNEVGSSEDNALILSRNIKKRVEWFYDCSPNKNNWVVSVTQGSTDRVAVEKQFDQLYEIAKDIYGLPERSTKELASDQQLLGGDVGPFSAWNTKDNNVISLSIRKSYFHKSDVEKWAINIDVVTNKQADCSTLLGSKKLCLDR